MTIVVIEIKQCPVCGVEFASWNVVSHNTIGAKFFTDGFVEGPMYGASSALLRCASCSSCFWREDAPVTRCETDPNALPQSLNYALDVQGSDFNALLSREFWKCEAEEKYIRIRAWWSFNSAYRGHATEDFEMPAEQETNLLRLLQLLNTANSHESIMRAEVFRELGQFDSCLKQLDAFFEEDHRTAVDVIKNLAIRKNRTVAAIK